MRRGVGVFQGRGGTVAYLLTPDGALVVDSQYPDTAPICLEGLKPKAPKGIELLVNTHHHADHTGGNIVFKPHVQRIVAHERCVVLQREVAEKAGTLAQQAFANTTFTDAWKVDLGGEAVSAKHWGPGHTSGDAVITFEKANVVHGGDLLWNKFHPRVDTTAGASVVNWVVALEKFSAQHDADTRYIFGHGQPAAGVLGARADVLLLRDYLSAALDHVKKGLAAKQSKAEITAPVTLPRFEAWVPINQNLTLTTMLSAIYDELSV